MTKASPKIQLLGAVFGAAVACLSPQASLLYIYYGAFLGWGFVLHAYRQGLIDAATS